MLTVALTLQIDSEQPPRMKNNPRSTRYSSLPLKDVVCLCAGPCDDDAWEEFVSRVGRPLSLVIMRTASMWGQPSRSVVEDLIQATYLKLWEGGRSLLRDFALRSPEAILGYLKRTAANATHDYFKHGHSQSSGGNNPHLSTFDVDPEAGNEVHGSQEKIAFGVFLDERGGQFGAIQESEIVSILSGVHTADPHFFPTNSRKLAGKVSKKSGIG